MITQEDGKLRVRQMQLCGPNHGFPCSVCECPKGSLDELGVMRTIENMTKSAIQCLWNPDQKPITALYKISKGVQQPALCPEYYSSQVFPFEELHG